MRATARMLLALSPLLLSGCVRLLDAATGAGRIEPAALLAQLPGPLVLDLRAPDAYARGHVPGALNLTFAEVNGYLHRARARGDRTVVFVCQDGIDASLAVPTARVHGFTALALAGGMARWQRMGLPLSTEATALDVDSTAPPAVELSVFGQRLEAISGLVIKPTYMLLALALAVWLRRRATTLPLRLLWHGLLWFFVGEVFCAVNIAFHLPGRVHLADVLHGAGMVVMSALISWGAFALVDERVMRLTDPAAACRVQALCGRCWKRDPVRCSLHDLMFLVAAACAIVSLMPLSLDLRPAMAAARVLGTPVDVGVPIVNHLVELRVYPILGSGGFLATLLLLRGGPRAVQRAEPAFFLSVGFTAYALLRFLLASTFRDAPYFWNFWEELTELFLVASLGLLLVLLRRQLGLVGAPVLPDATASASGA